MLGLVLSACFTNDPPAEDSGSTTPDGATEPTGGTTGTTGATETGAPNCASFETVALKLPATAIEDAGFVFGDFASPCPWGGEDCGNNNYGHAGAFRMIWEPETGVSAGLFRFDIGSLEVVATALGIAVADIVGFRLGLGIAAAEAAPAVVIRLQIGLVDPDNADWVEGEGDGTLAEEGDSNAMCKAIMAGTCVPWASDSPVTETALPVAVLTITAAQVVEYDIDADPESYRLFAVSELMPLDPIVAGYDATGEFPSLVVTLAEPRSLDAPAFEIGFRESVLPPPTCWSRSACPETGPLSQPLACRAVAGAISRGSPPRSWARLSLREMTGVTVCMQEPWRAGLRCGTILSRFERSPPR